MYDRLTYLCVFSVFVGLVCLSIRSVCLSIWSVCLSGLSSVSVCLVNLSLLPIVSRVLEKCINIRIYEHLECHKFLHQNQFGFRKGKTTEISISFILTINNDALDKKLRAPVVFFDLIMAFEYYLKNMNKPVWFVYPSGLSLCLIGLSSLSIYLSLCSSALPVCLSFVSVCPVNISVLSVSMSSPSVCFVFRFVWFVYQSV